MEICGILPVRKPAGPTSHDVVDRVRRLYGTQRVGHTGTLDPLAEGLLVVCMGKATKLSRYIIGLPKTYRATIRLGWRTTTGDREGETVQELDTNGITPADIMDALQNFRGTVEQKVPAQSAVKVGGRRLYKYARAGGKVPEVVRNVEIHQLELEHFDNPNLTVIVRCSRGTYIRTLAEDIGAYLKCGGSLASLVRTKIGDFDIGAAEDLDELADLPTVEERLTRLRPFQDVVPFPVVVVGADRIRHIRDGRRLQFSAVEGNPGHFHRGEKILICDPDRQPLAVGIAEYDAVDLAEDSVNPWFRYERVLV